MDKVIKRNDVEQDFCLDKIVKAIKAANDSVEKENQMDDASIQKVVNTVMKKLDGFTSINVEDIQDMVEQALVRHNKYAVSKAYILFRQKKKENKKFNEIEEKALSLINGTSDLRGDNANKHIDDNGATRDYLAGIVCKSIFEKTVSKDVVKAHKKGLIHFHDTDYSPAQKEHNCDVLNIEDQFKNSFQMQSTLIEPNEDTPFRTACNLLAQIHLIVSGRQYGGQTISWSHLLPFIDSSRKLFRKEIIEDFAEEGITLSEEALNKKVEKKLRKDIYEGVKTYQYQILCHSSSNGQTPFVSNNLCLREAQTQQELDDFAMLIEEIFNRRIKGVKDESGHYISPLFPKLLYWTCDGLNVKKGDPYFYLTELAAKCEVKRMQPDIVSERETRKVKQGQIIPSMGCRSLLAPIWEENTYPVDTEFYWTIDRFSDGISYPYGTFVEKKSFESVPNGEYTKGDYQINFRGNTGWLIKKTDDSVTILEPKVYGRWNNGVVTINLPHVALESLSDESLELLRSGKIEEFQKTVDMNNFYKVLDERLELCRKALQERYKSCCSIKGKNSPILWQYGALARIGAEDTVGDLMKKYPQRASISLGYVGLFETCVALLGESNTMYNGRKLSKEILTYLNKKCDEWREIDHMNYSIYGTPEESLTYKFALANRKDFGVIPRITDKDYVVNSYHVDPREHIDAFKKIEIEGEYLSLSSGGAVSYIETPDISNNIDAVISIIQWMHTHIVYAEINRKIGVCYECGYEGDIPLTKTEDGRFEFTCPNCGNKDDNKMHVMARLCGYLGTVNAGNTNKGRLDDIYHRTVHLDNFDEN